MVFSTSRRTSPEPAMPISASSTFRSAAFRLPEPATEIFASPDFPDIFTFPEPAMDTCRSDDSTAVEIPPEPPTLTLTLSPFTTPSTSMEPEPPISSKERDFAETYTSTWPMRSSSQSCERGSRILSTPCSTTVSILRRSSGLPFRRRLSVPSIFTCTAKEEPVARPLKPDTDRVSSDWAKVLPVTAAMAKKARKAILSVFICWCFLFFERFNAEKVTLRVGEYWALLHGKGTEAAIIPDGAIKTGGATKRPPPYGGLARGVRDKEAGSPGHAAGSLASGNTLWLTKDHFCALYRQAVDDQRADIDTGRAEPVVENHLVEPFLEMDGDAADEPAVDAADLQYGTIGKDIRPRSDGDHGGLVEGIGPVGHQLDAIDVQIAGHRSTGVGRQVEEDQPGAEGIFRRELAFGAVGIHGGGADIEGGITGIRNVQDRGRGARDGIDRIPVIGSGTDRHPVAGAGGGSELNLYRVGGPKRALHRNSVGAQGHHGQGVAVDNGVSREVVRIDINGVDGISRAVVMTQAVADIVLAIAVARAIAADAVFVGLGEAHGRIADLRKRLVVAASARAVFGFHHLDSGGDGDETSH